MALRLYTRFRIVRAPGWDDLFIGLALVRTFPPAAHTPLYQYDDQVLTREQLQVTGSISGISLAAGTISPATAMILRHRLIEFLATKYGMGHHIYEIPRGDLEIVFLVKRLRNFQAIVRVLLI